MSERTHQSINQSKLVDARPATSQASPAIQISRKLYPRKPNTRSSREDPPTRRPHSTWLNNVDSVCLDMGLHHKMCLFTPQLLQVHI